MGREGELIKLGRAGKRLEERVAGVRLFARAGEEKRIHTY